MHPTLFKYTLDQEDKDRLVESNVISIKTCSPKKVNVLIVDDIIELAENMQIETCEILRHSFKCPPGMIDKMKIFIDLVKTDPCESDESLLKKADPEFKSDQSVSDEDLGFLQNMNLSSLVREFESGGSILSLADDVVDSAGPFSDLEDHQNNGTMTDSLNDIEFE